MSFFKKAINSTLNFFSPIKERPRSVEPHLARSRSRSRSRSCSHSKRSASAAFENEHDLVAEVSKNKRRRRGSHSRHVNPDSRGRAGVDYVDGHHSAPVDTRPKLQHNDAARNSAQQLHATSDRVLMPPPSTPQNTEETKKKKPRTIGRKSLDHNDAASLATRSTRFAHTEVNDEYDMEEARRRAAATRLPPNSGIWEIGEQELFFHLSYRGFEPLLPYSWMIDFPTLPISVFAQQDDEMPLIEHHRSTPFRATKALEELLLVGAKIRDHNVSTQDLRSEPILEKATKRYITWALQDLGLPVKASLKRSIIPVHVITTMRPDQSTQEVLHSLATSMHTLADRYRQEAGVRTSIETSHDLTPPRSLQEETSNHHKLESYDLPVIYGVAICRTIMTVFTLNCHTSLPSFVAKHLGRTTPNLKESHTTESSQTDGDQEKMKSDPADGDEDLGLRYIAAFDFSDTARDVWNSFVVAILAIQIRKTLDQAMKAKANAAVEIPQQEDDLVDESWMSNINGTDEPSDMGEKVENDDPDA